MQSRAQLLFCTLVMFKVCGDLDQVVHCARTCRASMMRSAQLA